MKPQRVIPFLLLVGSLFLAVPAAAQEREIDAGRRKLEALKREAVELEGQGKHDAAAARRADAEKVARYLHDLRAKMQDQTKQPHDADPKRILGGLEQGIVALRALGRNDEAEHLLAIARDVKQRYAAHAGETAAKERGKEKPKEKDGAAREREVAAAQVELLGLAMKAMQEANRPDAADMLERAIHVRKLALAGRADEARQAHEGSPNREQLAELVAHASKLWAEWGHERQAEQLGRLAKELTGKKAAPPAKRAEGGEGGERIEKLERQLVELRQALEKLHAEVRKIRA